MIYNLANEHQRNLAYKRIDYLSGKGKRVEIKEAEKKRTNLQNKYIHVLFREFNSYQGGTFQETKDTLKEEFGYYADIHGERHFISTASMSTKLMAIFIGEILDLGYMMGYRLSDPDEYNLKRNKDGWYYPAEKQEGI